MRVFYLVLLLLTGCGLSRMNRNMEISNESIQINTATVEKSTSGIATNTKIVEESTRTMQEVQKSAPMLLSAVALFFLIPFIVLFVAVLKHNRKLDQILRKRRR